MLDTSNYFKMEYIFRMLLNHKTYYPFILMINKLLLLKMISFSGNYGIIELLFLLFINQGVD